MTDPDTESKLNIEITSSSSQILSTLRHIFAYGLMGLCNNYQYVTILVAANDMNWNNLDASHTKLGLSTGSILLAEIIPGIIEDLTSRLFAKSTIMKLSLSAISSLLGFYMVGFGKSLHIKYLGICVLSYSIAVSFTALVNHLAHFNKRLINAYLFGAQFGNIFAPMIYIISAEYLPFASRLIPMTAIPAIQLLVFWVLLKKREVVLQSRKSNRFLRTDLISILKNYRKNWRSLSPHGIVIFLQFYMNLGLFQHLPMSGVRVSPALSYRLYNAVFKAGHFLGSIVIYFFWTSQTWILTLVQLLNFIFVLAGCIYIMNVWFLLVIIVFEGLVSGFSYMCTFKTIQEDDKASNLVIDLKTISRMHRVCGVLAGTSIIISDNVVNSFDILGVRMSQDN